MVSRSEHEALNEGIDAWAAQLRCVLDDRAALLVALESVSSRQEELIESRDATRLLELLVGRQPVVDRFVAGQPELLELTQALEERLVALSASDADEIRGRMRRLSEGLARVTDRDEVAQAALRRARDETRSELNRTTSGAGARAAYGASTSGTRTAFADRRG